MFKYYAFDLSYFTKCLFDHVRTLLLVWILGIFFLGYFNTKHSLCMECGNLYSWKNRHKHTQTTIIILFNILVIKWVNSPKTTRQLLYMLKLWKLFTTFEQQTLMQLYFPPIVSLPFCQTPPLLVHSFVSTCQRSPKSLFQLKTPQYRYHCTSYFTSKSTLTKRITATFFEILQIPNHIV